MLKLVTISGPKNTWKVIQALSFSESLSLLVPLHNTHALNMLQLMETWNITIMHTSYTHMHTMYGVHVWPFGSTHCENVF